ncbi:hypothetical protein [Thalassotalea ganghwensis]
MQKIVIMFFLATLLLGCFNEDTYINQAQLKGEVLQEIKSYIKTEYIDDQLQGCYILNVGYPKDEKQSTSLESYRAKYTTQNDKFHIKLSKRRLFSHLQTRFANSDELIAKMDALRSSIEQKLVNSEDKTARSLISATQSIIQFAKKHKVLNRQSLPGTNTNILNIDDIDVSLCQSLLAEEQPRIIVGGVDKCELTHEQLTDVEGQACYQKVGVTKIKSYELLSKEDPALYDLLILLTNQDTMRLLMTF